MALGVEKNWRKAFQGILTQPPEWYRGSSYGPGFYPMMFANDLSSMSTRASSVMTSAPRSSGGSGFGGGGSSGGGFGGGGGGGFWRFLLHWGCEIAEDLHALRVLVTVAAFRASI